MRGTIFELGTRLLMAAMLLATSGMPPAISHVHSGGDRPHQHGSGRAHDHYSHLDSLPANHSHPHGDAGIDDDHFAVAAAPPASRHVHLSCLVFELTFPVSSLPPGQEEDDNSDASSAYYLVPDDGCAADLRPSQSAFVAMQLEPLGLSSRELVDVPLARFGLTTVIAAPLCDTARHERSGVQLI